MKLGEWYYWGKSPDYLQFIKVLGFDKVNDKDTIECLELTVLKGDYQTRKIGYVVEQLRPGGPHVASEIFIHVALMFVFGEDL